MSAPFAAKANDLPNILFAGCDDLVFLQWEQGNGFNAEPCRRRRGIVVEVKLGS